MHTTERISHQNYTYPNGVTSAYSYDTLNRLTQMGSSKNATSISNYAYTLGLAGNRLTVAELSGRTVNYGYDSLYRLTSEAVTSDPNNHDGATSYTLRRRRQSPATAGERCDRERLLLRCR